MASCNYKFWQDKRLQVQGLPQTIIQSTCHFTYSTMTQQIYATCCSHKLLTTFMKFLPLFGNIWQLVAFYVTMSSSCHPVLFSSVSLIACKFDSLSIYELVNLLAFQLVSFSACASWSLWACFLQKEVPEMLIYKECKVYHRATLLIIHTQSRGFS